jgi:hypothetical protein
VRAFYNCPDPLAIEGEIKNCVVTKLNKTSDSHNSLVGRVYALGSGLAGAVVTLNGAAIAITDYLIGHIAGKGWYLEHTPTWNAYGIESVQNYSDLSSPGELCLRAYEDMDRQLTVPDQYDISISGLLQIVNPLDIVRLVAFEWVDSYLAFSVAALLNVISTTDRIDSDGMRTVGMSLSTIDKAIRRDGHVSKDFAKMILSIKNHG